MDPLHVFLLIAGLYVLGSGLYALKTGEIRSRVFSWVWQGETWQKGRHPWGFWLTFLFHLFGGVFLSVVAVLAMFGLISLQ